MGMIFNAWGPAGTLSGYRDFAIWLGNGVSEHTPTVDPAVIGDRANVEIVSGSPAIHLRHYVGDGQVYGPRTEVTDDHESDIADWVGTVPGASVNNATRKYRVQFMLPAQDLSFLTQPGAFYICAQIHQIPDTSPADTAGLTPAMSVQIRSNEYGRLRYAIVRNTDPTETVTVNDVTKHSIEVASWPFQFGVWEDIMVDAKWSYSSAGSFTVYRNRRHIFAESAAGNCPNNSPARGGGGLYLKIGPYLGTDETVSVYHRGMLIGDHEATFADMHPETPGAVALERASGPVAVVAL